MFNPSNYFASWLAAEAARRKEELYREHRKRRKKKKVEVKLGHGGTLDPMATGVLIIGVGAGTKCLQNFLGCTKTYEATILFGAATDSYDTLGKVLNKAPYAHITKDMVEKALEGFKGKILQRPPLYSALHVQGKRLYEYAREGKEVPVEIQERPVEVDALDIVECLIRGTHNYAWPSQEAEPEEKGLAEKVLHLQEVPSISATSGAQHTTTTTTDSSKKRKRADIEDTLVSPADPNKKRQDVEEDLFMSGGLKESEMQDSKMPESDPSKAPSEYAGQHELLAPIEHPPAVKLRMTVTSGFYVRSLAHDLGKAVNSLGCMCDLVRTRQERFDLGRNVLEWSDIEEGEERWAPRMEASLKSWHDRNHGLL